MRNMTTTLPPQRPTTGRGSRGGTSRRLPGEMTEDEWQQRITDTASTYGWRWFHAPKNLPYVKGGKRKQAVRSGFPDLVLVRDGRLIFAELKSRVGRATPEQIAWLRDLDDVPHVEAYLWKPQDWPEVLAILSRSASPGVE